MDAVIEWLLASDEPWTRYRTLVDLLGESPSTPAASSARREILAHPKIKELISRANGWGELPLKRHNDASHPLYALSTLADLGLVGDDPGMQVLVEKLLVHQSNQGAFQTLMNVSKAFGGTGEDVWTWMSCDAPTVLYCLISFGLGSDPRVQKALDHLIGLVDSNGWRCICAPELGKFHGPGRRTDPCPVANLFTLKALSLVPQLVHGSAAHTGAEMLLSHWADPANPKPYLFGAGTDFRKLKYPFIWYDILHVAHVLSRYAFVRDDPRYQQMVLAITTQAGPGGRYTATSMYQSWKGWSFADKMNPSPWLTCLVHGILAGIS